tara:strand:+ start:49 stop:306 length:258 start_codon:yes stop_codon:yes gene_type:complete
MTEKEKLNSVIDAMIAEKRVLENRIARMADTIRNLDNLVDALDEENRSLKSRLRDGRDDGLINDPIDNMRAQFQTNNIVKDNIDG